MNEGVLWASILYFIQNSFIFYVLYSTKFGIVISIGWYLPSFNIKYSNLNTIMILARQISFDMVFVNVYVENAPSYK